MKSLKKILLWLPLLLLIILTILVFYLHLNTYLNFENLKIYHHILSQWTQQNYVVSVLIFIGIYILAVSSSTPIPLFLNLVSGFLFGLFWGTLYVLFGATVGAIIVFFAVNTTLGHWLKNRAAPWRKKMQKGIQKNAFTYLLILRITPLFPIWLVNIMPAILNIPFRIFLLTTIIGTIPGSFFYVAIGNGLTHVIDPQKHVNFRMIFTPTISISIIFLTLLSFLPIFYKKLMKK